MSTYQGWITFNIQEGGFFTTASIAMMLLETQLEKTVNETKTLSLVRIIILFGKFSLIREFVIRNPGSEILSLPLMTLFILMQWGLSYGLTLYPEKFDP